MKAVRVLLAVLVVVAPLVVRPHPAAASTAEMVAQVDHLAAAFPGGAGLWIADPNASKPLYAKNPDEHIIAASLYKLGVLAEAERRVDTGELRYTDIITIQTEDITDDGSFEPAGTELTLDRALEVMITVSDNGAAMALWHLLGGANIDATLTKAGMPDFHVAYNESEDNVVTPRAIGQFFTLLAQKKLLSAAASERMLARLKRQQINDRLPAALPDGVDIAHKTGNLVGLVHDAGIIYTSSGPRVVVAMTWDAYEDDARAFIANIGAIVYGAILEPPANARYAVPRSAVAADTDSTVRVTVTVTNAGTNTWAATGAGAVGLIWELRDDPGDLLSSSPTAVRLPALAPSKSGNVGLQIPTPVKPGVYHVTIGLADSGGRALAESGAATASFDIKTHLPYLLSAQVVMPTVLHRGEPSLLVTHYTALPTAGSVERALTLTWRAIDGRTSRVVTQGSAPVGVLRPGSYGSFYSSLMAPNLRGTYRLSYELREGDIAVTDTFSTTVTINGARTYPDDQGGRTPAVIPAAPTPSPSIRPPFPTPTGALVPKVTLPALPTALPKGKSPSPSFRDR